MTSKNIGNDNSAAHPIGGNEHCGGKNLEKSFHLISILKPAKLTRPQSRDAGSLKPYFAGFADAGISAVLPTVHFVSIFIL